MNQEHRPSPPRRPEGEPTPEASTGPESSRRPGPAPSREPAIGDPVIDEPVAALESVPADDLGARLDAGERLHRVLTDRMAQTGRDGL